MSIITARQLHQETKLVLNQLEQGESLLITRNGRTIGRIEPLTLLQEAKQMRKLIEQSRRLMEKNR